MKQLSFLEKPTGIALPDTILEALNNGAALMLSCSGGKDSDAMTYALLDAYKQHGWTGEVVIVHADLGRMERTETPAYMERFAARFGIELIVVRHPKYDLLEGFRQRMLTLQGQGKNTPPFSSAANRFCTSDWKREPINRFIRNRWVEDATVICAMGLRAEESPARAKKAVFKERESCQAPTKNRVVYDWNPIHHWELETVWEQLGYSLDGLADIQQHCSTLQEQNLNPYAWLYNIRFNAHPAYALGNERLSCGMCILGCQSDIRNGAYDNPETYQALVDIELESGFSFQQDKPLYKLAPDLLRPDQLDILEAIS
jgi:3'-phosphoadenosine 5'-phosphosulfate sulfotransferase (PAPS reductase)/FAD synthetase